eukprot:TRINITY_DN23154_c0_g1_i1.p1 TRINITY_DN23154_c0_g1~~TRINITY_DN23154_c0_g1_i1.p1  ORF type:complete len:679 (+),score=140.07 TRINITY_DN23154_c0_g1_i1:75-2039(+)
MCGIFAYINYKKQKKVSEVMALLIGGLKRLEYRGYDSAGVCVDQGRGVSIIKRGGNVSKLEAVVKENEANIDMDAILNNHSGIAHTRWATHGQPCDTNAHPISSGEGDEFVVVHNGIVTNFNTLKTFFEKRGEVFVSETDTEVICKLLKYLHDAQTPRDRKEPIQFHYLVMEAMSELEGAFALVVKSIHYPGEVVCCKRGSPMIVGIKGNNFEETKSINDSEPKELFVASDASAIVEHTRSVMYLEDEDVLYCDKEGVCRTFNAKSDKRLEALGDGVRLLHQMNLELHQIMKGDYDHFMQKEIFEQPESIKNTMKGRVDFEKRTVSLGGFVNTAKDIKRARRMLFIACGTSYYSAQSCRSILEELVEVPVVVELASDFLDRNPPIFRDDVCCFVSQSGETADTYQALEYCRSKNALTVGFTNVVGSHIARKTDCGCFINAGCEIGVASTKAYTSQVACFLMLGLKLSEDSRSKLERRNQIFDGLLAMPDVMRETLKLDDRMKELAHSLKNEKSILVIGRGYNYAVCLEGALKIKELTYIHSEGILAGELKHGPLALIDEDMAVIMIASKDDLYAKVKSGLQQILARKGRPIVFLTEEDDEMKAASEIIMLPKTVDCLQPLVNVIPLQMLSYHIAVARGLNVDCPRNLAKSVTTG